MVGEKEMKQIGDRTIEINSIYDRVMTKMNDVLVRIGKPKFDEVIPLKVIGGFKHALMNDTMVQLAMLIFRDERHPQIISLRMKMFKGLHDALKRLHSEDGEAFMAVLTDDEKVDLFECLGQANDINGFLDELNRRLGTEGAKLPDGSVLSGEDIERMAKEEKKS